MARRKRNAISRVVIEMADQTRYDFTISRKLGHFMLAADWVEVPSGSPWKAHKVKLPLTLTLEAAVKKSVRTAGVNG